MNRRILVKVSPTGAITIEADGFKGKVCADATKAFEEALGVAMKRSLKPEFRQQGLKGPIRQQLGNGGEEP